jgi:preprotein translocase subunit SecG
MENNLMNTKNNTPLVIAFVLVIVLFLLFGGGAMTGGMMNSGINNGMNGGMHGNGWLDERSWMWFPAVITLGLGIVLGWIIFKKKE